MYSDENLDLLRQQGKEVSGGMLRGVEKRKENLEVKIKNLIEQMPSLIETHEAKAEALAKDIPALQEVVKATWRKEDELKELKTELAALNRKIELSLKPIDEGEDKKEEKKQENTQSVKSNVDYADYSPNAMRKTVIPRAML
ncbi:MAG: hypothetical protein LBD80_07060 [Tannerella sp.]|jgi:phage tail tube protein FII|nr:hypothetical protein [Tannerella sp.]